MSSTKNPIFSIRSHDAELMDQAIDNPEELFLNLRELERINQLTGGPALGFRAIRQLLASASGEIHLVDIGFGAGDMLRYVLEHAPKLPCQIRLTGVDLMPETLDYIKRYYPTLPKQVHLEICDYQDWVHRGGQADIIHAGLFCHHLSDTQLVDFFQFCKQARIGAVINDLARAATPYYFIKAATALFSKSRFTKHDAPLSVLRAFTKQELQDLLDLAGVPQYDIRWKWAYRYLLTISNTPI